MAAELKTDVAILMPTLGDTAESRQRFTERYAGLVRELGRYEVEACFVQSHASFDVEERAFHHPFDINHVALGSRVQASVVRDLTMGLDEKPVHRDARFHVVHHPETTRFIADKSTIFAALPEIHPFSLVIDQDGLEQAYDTIPGRRIIIKPVTGQRSRGIRVLAKGSGVMLEPGRYLASEFLDTSIGMPEHDIQGIHNLRIISIASKAIGGIARLKGDSDSDILQDDHYGAFVHPSDMSDSIHHIIDAVHALLRTKPGGGNNVIAIDVMRGIDSNGVVSDVLCEVNRRPMRVSPWNLRNSENLDMPAIQRLGYVWDKAEAAMLAGLIH